MCHPKREALAAYAHNAWSAWMRYLFSKSQTVRSQHEAILQEGDVVIPKAYAQRWKRQIKTYYHRLPPEMQKSDLEEADKMLMIVDKKK